MVAALTRFLQDRKKSVVPVLLYGGLIFLVWSPWLIKNILYTGNPVHPLLHRTFGAQNLSERRSLSERLSRSGC